MKKCPNGMYSEIKYDGERVQVHKNGDNFSYFSRSLKPVLPHKVSLLTLPHAHTCMHAHTHTCSLGSCPVIIVTSGYNLLSSAPC